MNVVVPPMFWPIYKPIMANWSDAAQAYSTALAAAETLYRACILLDSKAAELAETADLPRCATYAYGKIGQLETAVVALEANRARGLSESLDRDRANLNQLQEIAPHLYEQYQNIANQLDNLESQQRDRSISSDRHSLTPEAFRNTATQLRSELETTIAQIRQVEGYADFLDQPNFDDIRAALQPKRPLIYLVVTSAGSLALVVTSDGIANLWLNDLTETSLQELLQTWFNAYSQSQSDLQNWLNAINSVTHQLWQPLMEPLVRHLKAHNLTQAILVPTGYLSLLPLHAAWTEDSSTPTGRHYALDDIHFTYAPNARSLTAAQAIRHSHPSQLNSRDRQPYPRSTKLRTRSAICDRPFPTASSFETWRGCDRLCSRSPSALQYLTFVLPRHC